MFTNRGFPFGFAPLQPMEYNLGRHVSPGDGMWTIPGMPAPSTSFGGERFMLLIQLSSSYSINIMGHTDLGAQQSHLIPPPSIHGEEGSSFPGCVPLDDMVSSEYVVGIIPANSGVLIGYQVCRYDMYQGIVVPPW